MVNTTRDIISEPVKVRDGCKHRLWVLCAGTLDFIYSGKELSHHNCMKAPVREHNFGSIGQLISIKLDQFAQ